MPWWLLAVAAAGVMIVSWLRWSVKEANARALEGQRALDDGDFARAEAIFAAMMQERATKGRGRELLARTRMRQERLQDAIDLYLGAERSDQQWVSLELALLYVLRGDVESAERFVETARSPARGARESGRHDRARLLLVDAAIRARRGDLEGAWALLAQGWGAFEMPERRSLAEACLLRGFVGWKLGGSVESWLGLTESARARVRWLGAEWPELRAFLDAHDL